MKLYVARHGETQWNLEGKVCGRTDLPLTEKGLRQAQALAEKMGECKIDLIISSPLLRARQTAAATAEKWGIPMLVDDRLTEQNFGIYEGADRFDSGFVNNKKMFTYRYPQGESILDVAARIYGLLHDVKCNYPEKNVLLVCHGGICRVIRAYFEDMTNEEFLNYVEDNASAREYAL